MRRVLESIIFEVIARTFIRSLDRELAEYSIPDPALARIKEAGKQVFNESREKQTDLQACGILAMCSLVLAAYRELSTAIKSRESAQEVVDRAFSSAFSSEMRFMAGLAMAILRDPVKILSHIPLARFGRWIYGESMGFQQWSSNDSAFHVVNRCAFHQFFVDQGEPTLTRLFCKCDAAWMNVINKSGRPIRIDRPTTISTGSETCQFIFTRDDPSSPRDSFDVVGKYPGPANE